MVFTETTMKKLILCLSISFVFSSGLRAQTSHIITYQGAIASATGASVRDSIYPIAVTLWTDSAGGTALWRDVFETPVKNGIFNIALGSQKPLPAPAAMDRALWFGVSFNGGVESRTAVGSVPTAINVADSSITTAKLADRSVTWNKMGTEYVPYIRVNGAKVNTGQNPINFTGGNGLRVDFDTSSMSVIIQPDSTSASIGSGRGATPFKANGNGGSDWSEKGNTGTTPGTNYAGTSDSVAFEIHVNDSGMASLGNRRVMRYEPTAISPNIVGGWNGNSLQTGVYGAVIAGGGASGLTNRDSEAFGTIAGGEDNSVSDGAGGGTISGGVGGRAYDREATIGGGYYNTAGDRSPAGAEDWAPTVGGGKFNLALADEATVAGGENDTASAGHTAIAGGYMNVADSLGAAVGGGEFDRATGSHSVVAGGEGNTASGNHAVVLGGWNNIGAGNFSSVLGGNRLELGDSSIGFSGSSSSMTTTNLSADMNVAYLGNVDLWIGNVDDTARQVRFYAPNHNFMYSGADYSSFQAGTQTGNINYTLPDTLPSAHQFLEAKSITGTNVQLAWDTVTGSGGAAGWALHGNSSVPSPSFYLGTQDSEAFEIHIHNNTLDTTGGNQRVMQYSEGPTSPNILGGSSFDSITPGLSGAAILSGGSKLAPNIVSDTFSVIGGGRGNLIQGPLSVIAGGDSNQITTIESDHNVIGGGYQNIEADPSYGVIGGGVRNYLASNAYSSMIGGGEYDSVFGSRSFMGAGGENIIAGGSYNDFSVLVGGQSNKVESPYTFLGGGYGNYAHGNFSTLGGGYLDTANLGYGFLGGGFHNVMGYGSDTSVLVGGANNYIAGYYSALIGGKNDTIRAAYSLVGGGFNNTITRPYSTITGGWSNEIQDTLSFIGGGYGNKIMPDTVSESVIGGGWENVIDTNAGVSVIAGGQSNYTGAVGTAIGGGLGNTLERGALFATIGGGTGNLIAANDTITDTLFVTDTFPEGSVIAGGDSNTIRAPLSTIGGGAGNLIQLQSIGWCPCGVAASVGTIAGGIDDTIGYLDGRWGFGFLLHDDAYGSPIMASIGGGWRNTVNGAYGTVGGGYKNHALGMGSAIPGGIGLEALDFQTAVGRYNSNPSYTAQLRNYYHLPADTIASIGDEITFMVGNGTSADSAHRSNAFEVSDNGHSIVHDSLGNTAKNHDGSLRNDPIVGGTYRDNVINAWGDVSGTPIVTKVLVANSFGNVTVTHSIANTGTYTIYIQSYNSDGSFRALNAAAIQITVEENSGEGCGYATCNRIATSGTGNSFVVHTYNGVNPAAPGQCKPADRDFFFTLVGR